MTEQTDAAEVLAEAICPCAGDGDGQHIPELDQECAWSLSLARSVLASDWLAADRAAAEARGAQAVLAAVERVIGPDEIFPDWSMYPHRHRVSVKRRDLGAEVTTTMVEERAIREALTAARAAAAAAGGGGAG